MSNEYYGVLDRIEEGTATILIERIKKEINLDVKNLPPDTHEGDWLTIKMSGSLVESIEKNNHKTDDMKKKMENRLNRLKSNSRGSRFKKK